MLTSGEQYLKPLESSIDRVISFGVWLNCIEPKNIFEAVNPTFITVVERNGENINNCRESYESNGQFNFIHADMTDVLSDKNLGTYDLSFCSNVLYFFIADIKSVREVQEKIDKKNQAKRVKHMDLRRIKFNQPENSRLSSELEQDLKDLHSDLVFLEDERTVAYRDSYSRSKKYLECGINQMANAVRSGGYVVAHEPSFIAFKLDESVELLFQNAGLRKYKLCNDKNIFSYQKP